MTGIISVERTADSREGETQPGDSDHDFEDTLDLNVHNRCPQQSIEDICSQRKRPREDGSMSREVSYVNEVREIVNKIRKLSGSFVSVRDRMVEANITQAKKQEEKAKEREEKAKQRKEKAKERAWRLANAWKETPGLDDPTRFKVLKMFKDKGMSCSSSDEDKSGSSSDEDTSSDSSSDEDTSGSSSDDEEEEMMNSLFAIMVDMYAVLQSLCAFVLAWYGAGNSSSFPIRRMYTSNRGTITSAGSQYIHRLLCEDPEHFRQEFRMYPSVFQKLCKIIREKGILQDTRQIGVEEVIASFLLVVGLNHPYPSLSRSFGMFHLAISKNFHHGLHALNVLAVDFMAKPSQDVHPKIRGSTNFFPYFKDCIGALDSTHIPANVTDQNVSRYRNQHGTISQNVLAAYNFDLEFLYVLAGWEGSTHDSRVLTAALEKTNPMTIPQGKYYLVDCGFPNRRQFLAPFRGFRYHLQDFNGVGQHPENGKELFNLRHASIRNTVGRIFGMFKSRFAIFKSAPPFPYKTQVALVLACVGLHNFLRRECPSDEFLPDDELFPQVKEVEDDDEVDEDDDDDDDEGEDDDVTQTLEQEREAADVLRDEIVQQIWEDATKHSA